MDNTSSPIPERPGGSGVDSPPPPRRPAARSIRDRIIGGLILIMPLLLTLWIIGWLYSILEQKIIDPIVGIVLWKLKWTTSSTELPYWFEAYVAPILAIALALLLLCCLDLLAETRLRRAVGWTLVRVPVISQIYNPLRQMF